MRDELSYKAAVVDPQGDFIHDAENTLQADLMPSAPDLSVIGYRTSRHFLDSIESYPLCVPLVVIADIAARTPTVEQGIFAQVKCRVPRCACVLFSAGASFEECERMSRLGLVDRLVGRASRNAVRDLSETVRDVVGKAQRDSDWVLIRHFIDCMRTTPYPEESPVDDEELSPRRMLIEMVRGTDRGRRYINNLLPALARSRQGGSAT